MDREDLLRQIAETAYNVGFGAKKHFATFDLVVKVPGYIRFFSIACGIYSLAFDNLSNDFLSASLIVLGVVSLYISFYNFEKDSYEESGVALIQLFNKLKKLYFQTKTAGESSFSDSGDRLSEIEGEFYKVSISKQILFSDWYAHYKFFWEFQIDWIDEQKQFKLFRDKLPLTLSLTFLCALVATLWWIFTTIVLPYIAV